MNELDAIAEEAVAHLSINSGHDYKWRIIRAAIELYAGREPSEAVCTVGLNSSTICIREYYANERYMGRARSFSDKECGAIFRAMQAAQLAEIKEAGNGS